jgi:hypothetical protein
LTDVKRASLAKPTLQTRFHIDFEWWSKNDRDWRVYLRSNLCPEHQQAFADLNTEAKVISHCAKQEGFITQRSALVDAAFRLFLSNGNSPLNSNELGERLGRPPITILRTLTGTRVYKGLRPVHD